MRRIEDYRQSWRRNHKKEQNFISYLFWGISFSAIKKIRQEFSLQFSPLWIVSGRQHSALHRSIESCSLQDVELSSQYLLHSFLNRQLDRQTNKQKSWWIEDLSVACCGSTWSCQTLTMKERNRQTNKRADDSNTLVWPAVEVLDSPPLGRLLIVRLDGHRFLSF